jgi:hypothetical protein
MKSVERPGRQPIDAQNSGSNNLSPVSSADPPEADHGNLIVEKILFSMVL